MNRQPAAIFRRWSRAGRGSLTQRRWSMSKLSPEILPVQPQWTDRWWSGAPGRAARNRVGVMSGLISGARTAVNPLRQLTIDQLRQRTSLKWREYPDDVLPLWVAEMDVPLAEPVAAAITDGVARGDTGYPAGHGVPAGGGRVRRAAVGLGRLAVERTALVPDVDARHRRGAAAGHRAGRRGGRQLPGLPAVLRVRRARRPPDRRGAARPRTCGSTSARWRMRSGGARAGGAGRVPALQPAQPDRRRAHRAPS